MQQKPFYLTTTLPYVNADLHMGHALEFVRADIVARYKQLVGFDVFFNTGTDEHGMKIYEKAVAGGLSPQAFVDQSFERFRESVKIFGLDERILHYARTTSPSHEAAAQEFWRRCDQNGYIYKKNYQAKYCVGCEEVKTDSDLVSGECPVHPGRALETIEEENYFFKYSAFGEKLKELYAARPDFVVPDFRFNEIKAFVERGLEDFSISRLKDKMPWGIPVPGDDKHVMYVWFDALTNYISTLGWPDETSVSGGDFAKYWIGGTPTQYCGKDNLRFQSAMWQAMLMAAGVPNSHQIVINGFITAEGGVKMSKTLGNVVDPKDIVAEYGTDALRYFLASSISNFEDSPFTAERFKDVYNAKLANGIGNLTSRIMKMATTHIPEAVVTPDKQVELPMEYIEAFFAFNIQAAAAHIESRIVDMDQRIQKTEPFKLVKTDKDAAVAIIRDLVKELYVVGKLLEPLVPETSAKIRESVLAHAMPAPLFARKD